MTPYPPLWTPSPLSPPLTAAASTGSRAPAPGRGGAAAKPDDGAAGQGRGREEPPGEARPAGPAAGGEGEGGEGGGEEEEGAAGADGEGEGAARGSLGHGRPHVWLPGELRAVAQPGWTSTSWFWGMCLWFLWSNKDVWLPGSRLYPDLPVGPVNPASFPVAPSWGWHFGFELMNFHEICMTSSSDKNPIFNT